MKIVVTGGRGFLGSHLVPALERLGHEVFAPSRKEVNCLNRVELELYIGNVEPDLIVHLAALVGGIGANQAKPADFWQKNLEMGLNVLEVCRRRKIKKLLMAGTTCSYPKYPELIPFPEGTLYSGFPEETNAPYGIAKRALIEGARAYGLQHGIRVLTLISANLYGPGDNFDPNDGHVIPAMIFKMHLAKERKHPEVRLWGDGMASRDFLHVTDAVRAYTAAVELISKGSGLDGYINVGSGREIPISMLAGIVKGVVGFEGDTTWDTSKPNGQPCRLLDSSKASRILGWTPIIPLVEGIKQTYDWWRGTL